MKLGHMNLGDIKFFAAAIVLAVVVLGLAAGAGTVFYPTQEAAKRGFSVDVDAAGKGAKKEEESDIGTLLSQADAKRGQQLAKKCLACHTLEKGEPNRNCPNIYGVLGGPFAHRADFTYSSGMIAKRKEKGGWDYDDLFAFLAKPSAFIPGTKMTFAGFDKKKDIADMVLYLRTKNDTLPALPAPKPKAAEKKAEAVPAENVKP